MCLPGSKNGEGDEAHAAPTQGQDGIVDRCSTWPARSRTDGRSPGLLGRGAGGHGPVAVALGGCLHRRTPPAVGMAASCSIRTNRPRISHRPLNICHRRPLRGASSMGASTRHGGARGRYSGAQTAPAMAPCMTARPTRRWPRRPGRRWNGSALPRSGWRTAVPEARKRHSPRRGAGCGRFSGSGGWNRTSDTWLMKPLL